MIGLVLGTLNGLLVAKLTIPPIIVTLGTYSIYSGLIFIYSNGTQVDAVPTSYAEFGNGLLASWLPIPIPVVTLAVALLLCWFVLGHTVFGRAVLAVGNNAVAAYNAGVSVVSTQIRVYMISGVLAALARSGFCLLHRLGDSHDRDRRPCRIAIHRHRLDRRTAIAGGRGNMGRHRPWRVVSKRHPDRVGFSSCAPDLVLSRRRRNDSPHRDPRHAPRRRRKGFVMKDVGQYRNRTPDRITLSARWLGAVPAHYPRPRDPRFLRRDSGFL